MPLTAFPCPHTVFSLYTCIFLGPLPSNKNISHTALGLTYTCSLHLLTSLKTQYPDLSHWKVLRIKTLHRNSLSLYRNSVHNIWFAQTVVNCKSVFSSLQARKSLELIFPSGYVFHYHSSVLFPLPCYAVFAVVFLFQSVSSLVALNLSLQFWVIK